MPGYFNHNVHRLSYCACNINASAYVLAIATFQSCKHLVNNTAAVLLTLRNTEEHYLNQNLSHPQLTLS